MTQNILEKIFTSAARVKIMKLFLFNNEDVFDKESVLEKSKVTAKELQYEIKLLKEIKFIKDKKITKTSTTKTGKITKKKVEGFYLNPDFSLLKQLKDLLINNEPLKHSDIQKRIGKTGKIKLIIIAGVFLQADDCRVDLLIVGDELKKRSLENTIKTMESEIGKELRFSYLSTEDFKYRHSVCDRLIRDILDYKHEVVMDRIGIGY
jgi:hypothetical protein